MSLKYNIFLFWLSVFVKETTVITVRVKNMTFKLPLPLKKKKGTDGVWNFKCLYLIYVPLVQCRVKNIKIFSLSIRYIYFHTPNIEELLQKNWIFDLYLHLMLSLYQWQKNLCCDTEKLVINTKWAGLTKICPRSSEPYAAQPQSSMQDTPFQIQKDMRSWIINYKSLNLISVWSSQGTWIQM